jgi:hypothetical protein
MRLVMVRSSSPSPPSSQIERSMQDEDSQSSGVLVAVVKQSCGKLCARRHVACMVAAGSTQHCTDYTLCILSCYRLRCCIHALFTRSWKHMFKRSAPFLSISVPRSRKHALLLHQAPSSRWAAPAAPLQPRWWLQQFCTCYRLAPSAR